MRFFRMSITMSPWQVAKRLIVVLYTDDCLGWAAELAFYFFLSLFPALLIVVTVAGYLPIEHLMATMVTTLAHVAPPDLLQVISHQVREIAEAKHGGLLTFGVIVTLWSASSGVNALMDTLHQAYHVEDTRSWIRRQLLAVGLMLVLMAFLLISFVLVIGGPLIGHALATAVHLDFVFILLWEILRWPLIFVLVVTAVAMVYYFAPDVKQTGIGIAPGAIVSTVLWIGISLGFRWYVAHFATYEEIYGALGGTVVALLWFYLSGLAIIVGAEVNAVLEHASREGKDPGERYPGQREAQGGGLPGAVDSA